MELLGGDGSLRRSMRSCEEAHFRLVSAPDCAGLTWNRRRGESQQRKPRLRCSAAMTSWRQPRAAWPGRQDFVRVSGVSRLSRGRRTEASRDDPTETRRSDTRRYETSDPIRYETGNSDFCFFARCRNRLYVQCETVRDVFEIWGARSTFRRSWSHARPIDSQARTVDSIDAVAGRGGEAHGRRRGSRSTHIEG